MLNPFIKKCLLVTSAILTTSSSFASPVSTMVYGPKEVDKRIAGAAHFKLPMILKTIAHPAMVLMTPLQIKDLVDKSSNWTGVKSMLLMTATIDPGGISDGSNMFVYTCGRGWIDMGHVMGNGLATVSIRMILETNSSILKKQLAKYLEPEENKLLEEVIKYDSSDIPSWRHPSLTPLFDSLRLAMKNQFKKLGFPAPKALNSNESYIGFLENAERQYNITDRRELFYSYFAGFFSMRSGYKVEHIQNDDKTKQKVGSFDGWTESAWTLEDLPSDYLGLEMAAGLRPRMGTIATKKAVRKFLADFFASNGAVDPNNKTDVHGCKNESGKETERAGDILSADAKFYAKATSKSHVKFDIKNSQDSNSPYGYTLIGKKTIQHHCLCDNQNRPIAR